MTKQTLFTRVVRHLRTQGRPAKQREILACYYGLEYDYYRLYDEESGTVLKCAIGCLIPNKRYTPELEGRLVSTAMVREAAGLAKTHLRLAARLMEIHDSYPVEQWEDQFKKVAKVYRLRMPA